MQNKRLGLVTILYKKKQKNSKYILLFFIFYLSQFPAHIHRFKRAKSLQKVKHKIVNTFYYPYCDALWKLYIVCIRFHQLFEMSWCIY